jgi:transcription initiation factor IIE alpha subunit
MKTLTILLAMLITGYGAFAQKAKADSAMNKTNTVITTNYTCPMHPDVTSDKPGKCSKCGMDLTLSPKEIMKREVMKIYTCPMHPDVISDKPGKCSKCNMDLKEKKEAHSDHQH